MVSTCATYNWHHDMYTACAPVASPRDFPSLQLHRLSASSVTLPFYQAVSIVARDALCMSALCDCVLCRVVGRSPAGGRCVARRAPRRHAPLGAGLRGGAPAGPRAAAGASQNERKKERITFKQKSTRRKKKVEKHIKVQVSKGTTTFVR